MGWGGWGVGMTHTAVVWDDQRQTGELQGPGAHQPRPFMEGRRGWGRVLVQKWETGLVWGLNTSTLLLFSFNYHVPLSYQHQTPS